MSLNLFHLKRQSIPGTQARFRLLVFTLSLAGFVSALCPQLVRAEGLDELSGSLQQTMEQQTGSFISPTHSIESSLNITSHSGSDVVTDVISSHTQPDGNLAGQISHTLQSLLAPFQQQLQQYFRVFNTSFEQILSDVFGNVFGGGEQPWDEHWGASGQPELGGSDDRNFDIPDVITGALGIPDIIQNHKAIFDQATGHARQGTPAAGIQRADRFNLNPIPLAQSLQFMEDRAQNNGMAATVLSSEGQTAMKQEMEAATVTLQQIQAKAQEAQGMDVTQDVMKNLTALQANQSALIGGSYSQLMALRAQEAANNVVTSNISESLDEDNRARHAESMTAADHVLRTSAGFYLPGLVK